MATHNVTIDLPTRFVLHSDVTFAVWSDEAKLGELQVSKGSIDWLPGNGRTLYRMRWEKFNDLMREEGLAEASRVLSSPNAERRTPMSVSEHRMGGSYRPRLVGTFGPVDNDGAQ